ncbi:HIT domain [Serratia quinivorans]|uniref:HIT family protein n=1 Tax=Serratia TaxID=613 RepID=UPI00217AF241|nr:HIT family protein [Serratia quinivorans]CAI1193512.1 HIT domain [Serratia quinivorans]CAI1215912.1 HIT domain [Serratia quinivorans]CAI2014455.1 HIT domain [Serratia quinivorans]CAI2158295.1 HIT domain [Serratia quinivorans]CAI2528583.1 HIT domain [Serratia quinivorans]
MSCIFCDMVAGKVPCHKIWEDDAHMAFLSIYPNTEGFSVVIPKAHYPSYAFALPDAALSELMLATKRVAQLLDRAFDDVGRCGMVFEGFGVDHVHAKLIPMHGTAGLDQWQPIESKSTKFFDRYEGYLSSHDAARADDEHLAALAAKIRQRTL